MSMGAGEFNRKIQVERRSAGVDSLNQPLDTWELAFPNGLWSKILGMSGMAVIRNEQAGIPVSPGRYSFRIRYRATGISTAMRVIYAGAVFDIGDIRHDLDGHVYTDLICESGASNG